MDKPAQSIPTPEGKGTPQKGSFAWYVKKSWETFQLALLFFWIAFLCSFLWAALVYGWKSGNRFMDYLENLVMTLF